MTYAATRLICVAATEVHFMEAQAAELSSSIA